MQETTIGDAILVSNKGLLTMRHVEDESLSFVFTAEQVLELVRFLTAQTQSEFNRREAFRVPLFESSQLEVRVRSGETQIQGRPTSISMTGIFLAVSPANQVDAELEDEVEVVLQFEGAQHSHVGLIKRISNDGYGIAFLDATSLGQVDPPADIARIVMKLQREWVSRGN
ncbi:PilZ domain-containing protein [Stieleria marina]